MPKRDYKTSLSEADYQRFFGNEGVWRNDNHPEQFGDSPTVTIFITHSIDNGVRVGEFYSARIRHVRGFRGKGFMAALWHIAGGDWSGNGDAFYGTDQATYDKAVADGEQMMLARDQKMREDLARNKEAREEHKAKEEVDGDN